jgi:hypothetical protein
VTKLGKHIYVGLSGYEGKKCLNISTSLNAHCVFVLGIVSSMSTIGVMGCILQIFGENSSIAWYTI